VNENIRLMQRCTGLRNVTLRWETMHIQQERLLRFPEPEFIQLIYYDPVFPSVQDLVRRYHLEGLLAIDSVQSVTLRPIDKYTSVFVGGRPGQYVVNGVALGLLTDLCTWLRKRFLELGRVVEVRCERVPNF
jgi:hypothetical protein